MATNTVPWSISDGIRVLVHFWVFLDAWKYTYPWTDFINDQPCFAQGLQRPLCIYCAFPPGEKGGGRGARPDWIRRGRGGGDTTGEDIQFFNESLWYEFSERHYITLVKSFPNNKELGGGDTTGESQNAKTLAKHSNVSDWDPVWVCERPTRPSKSVFFWQDLLCFVSSVLDCL